MSGIPGILPGEESTATSHDYNKIEFAMAMQVFTMFLLHQVTLLFANKDNITRSTNSNVNNNNLDEPLTEGSGNDNDMNKKWKDLAALNAEAIWPAIIVFFIGRTVAISLTADISTTDDNYYSIQTLTTLIWFFTISWTLHAAAHLANDSTYEGARKIMYITAILSALSAACMLPYLVTTFYVPNNDDDNTR